MSFAKATENSGTAAAQSRPPAGQGQSGGRQTTRPKGNGKPQPQQQGDDIIETAEQEFRCRICDEPGHRASQCPTNVCYRCNGYGHLANVCPSSRNVMFCYKCGAQGVTVKDCPDCNGTQSQQQGNEEAGSQ